jgi:hypothetical protein
MLSEFLAKAAVDRISSARGEIVLNDQQRIQKALEGEFIPQPVETFIDTQKTEKNAPYVEEDVEMAEGDEDEEDQNALEADERAGFHAEQATDMPAVEETGEIDKEKRKADKKARMKEEKKKRAEERAKDRN